jgi:hypothetical protein
MHYTAQFRELISSSELPVSIILSAQKFSFHFSLSSNVVCYDTLLALGGLSHFIHLKSLCPKLVAIGSSAAAECDAKLVVLVNTPVLSCYCPICPSESIRSCDFPRHMPFDNMC